MSIRFQTADGRTGILDVAKLAADEMGGIVTGAKDGLCYIKMEDESIKAFSLAQWAESHQAKIIEMQGFNGPDSALEMPPNGMNAIDQSVFFNDGMDMDTLSEMFPQCQKRLDGRIVVLDTDGLWKTMWSPYNMSPLPPPNTNEMAQMNMVQDPRMTMRVAGVTFLLALAGESAEVELKPAKLVKALKVIARNAPYENKVQIGKLVEQTTGLNTWKFYNALMAPEETAAWIKDAIKLSSFQFRMKQADMSELVVTGMRSLAHLEFARAMKGVQVLPETKNLLINLKSLFSEFIQFLIGMDLLRDISKTTGLNEWISLNEDEAFDKTKLPAMPQFVEAFVHLLRAVMPIVQENHLAFAKGRVGFKAILNMMMMIDECIYSLAGVPDSSAKYKCFMALKKLQTQIETKLSFLYHPKPEDNKDGLKENPFMQAKARYTPKRETLYKICQLPKESWNNTLLASLRETPNQEQMYDTLPPKYAEIVKSFAAMDAAYDMQPWVDVNHAERTHDSFSQYNESFGLPPPEAGYLAKNSPRAVFNIAETLIQGAGVMAASSDEEVKQLLRNPWLMANLFKTLMVASVNRELGTVEVLAKFGITAQQDQDTSPDPHRIWEDPEKVQKEMDDQVAEMMGSMAMEAMMQQQGQQQQEQSDQAQAEAMRDGGQEEKAGAGPAGPAQRAAPMRR